MHDKPAIGHVREMDRSARPEGRPHHSICSVLLAGILLLSACRAPLGPAGTLDGTWRGSIVDSVAGSGTATLTMTQRGQGLSGTWSATFGGGAVTMGGSLGGSTVGATASLFLTPAAPLVCSPSSTLSGTLGVTATFSGNRLQGTYVVLTCTGGTNGTIDLTR